MAVCSVVVVMGSDCTPVTLPAIGWTRRSVHAIVPIGEGHAITGRSIRDVFVRALIAAALTALPLTAAAQASDPEPFTLASLGLKGQLLYKNVSYFSETPNDDRLFRNEGRLQVEWERRFAAWVDAKVIVEARKDDQDDARDFSVQIPETEKHRSVLDVKEAVLRLRGGPVEVSLGKQIYAWGTADAYNPTDLVNPYDDLDFVDNEKIGVWSASARFTLGPATLTTVVVPVFTPSRVPLRDTRWTPAPPPGFVAVVDNRELPSQDVDAMQYAVRLRGTVTGWDLSVSYYDGFKAVPELRRSFVVVAPGLEIPRLTPVFTRMRAPGFDWSTTFGKLELHGEGLFRFVVDNGRDDRFLAISGVNYPWDEPGVRWMESVTFIVEYAREVVLATRDRTILADNLLLGSAFREALIGRIEVKLTEDTRVKLTEIVDLARPTSHYTQIKLTHRFTDAWSVETGLDILTGSGQSFWGRWGDNDRVFLFARYLF